MKCSPWQIWWANVHDVAEFIILSAGEESDMTHLKLQKMLYFAQGTHLARTGTPLFEDAIQTWKLGPVVETIYQRYKVCGKNPIYAEGLTDSAVEQSFTEEEANTIIDVILEYGKYSASYLIDLTHAPGTPWDQTDLNTQISNNLIHQYFQGKDAAPAVKIDCSAIPTIGKRKNGVLVLPASDEDWSEFDEV